ncbi:MAG: insulinase family protein [Clostridia bacterium]|nr:insulinase family protein [Clostridia bacterium]
MELQYKKNDATGEELYYGTHSSGLRIFIIPKKGYSNNYAIFGTRYGSVDSEFIVPGDDKVTKVPDGIAHYLEHKMFDQPDNSNVFDKFSKYGANANAFTSFNMTAYLFSATANIEENVATLLDYVQSPYFTDDTVSKEQGIIGQEIRMYDDNGGWKVFFNLLNCLYHNHPVKKEIAGTVESIAKITPELLYNCYNTFYNLSNMAIVIVGDVNPEKMKGIIEANIKKNEPFSEEIKRIYAKSEPNEVVQQYIEKSLSVSTPLFMIGYKDIDTGYTGKALLKKSIEIKILLGMLFGKSSTVYKKLYNSGLINQNFGTDYTMQPDYAFTAIEGESKDPKAVYKIITDEIDRVLNEGLSEDDYNRMKKVLWGKHIRSQNDVDEIGTEFIQLHLMGVDYFDYYDVYSQITFEDIKNRFKNHFVNERSALSVVNPITN